MPNTEYPQDRSLEDFAHAAAQASVSLIPAGGGVLAEAIEVVWPSRLDRRRAEWLNELNDALNHLDLDVETLRSRLDDDELLDLFLEALRSAQRTSEAEKLEALRNAVLNSVLEIEEVPALRRLFIQRLADLDVSHLHLLKHLAEPSGGRPWSSAFSAQIRYDLDRMGLSTSQTTVFSSSSSVSLKLGITDFGGRFLRFIEEPQSLGSEPEAEMPDDEIPD